MPQILIYYEHKAREYQYCHALKYELKRRGYSVGICHLQNRHTWFYKLFSKPQVVLCGAVNLVMEVGGLTFLEHLTDFVRGRAPWVIHLQIEQLQRDEDSSYGIIQDSEVSNRIYYVCWGKRRQKQLQNAGIELDKTLVTGAMHLDFLRPEFSGFYKNKQEIGELYGLDSKRRWILYISSYTYVSAPKEKLVAWLGHIRRANPNKTMKDIEYRKESSIYSQKISLDWLDRYLSTSEDIIIYRPHPGERITPELRKMLETYPDQFFWIKDESVQQWISVCDVVDNWISTAVVEAYVARKHVNIVQPVHVPDDLQPAVLDGCTRIRTYEDFEAAQKQEQEFCDEQFPINHELLHDYYKLDGACSYLRVCDAIEEIYHQPAPDVGKSKFTLKVARQKWFLYRIYRSIYAVTRIKLSLLSPIKRKGLRNREKEVDIGMIAEDVLINEVDRENCKKIKRLVNEIGKSYQRGSFIAQRELDKAGDKTENQDTMEVV